MCFVFQLEEEEYTARIIHYFNLGLLTLPEGQTLRSYISKRVSTCFIHRRVCADAHSHRPLVQSDHIACLICHKSEALGAG